MEQLDLIPLIGNLGFPIFVSWYLLTRVESKMEALTSSIADMTQAIHGWQKET
ncbi:YvrJ family protein [Ammoniphilus sp. CFH 90114]|uniref:YvrJ family protein n=1 Tax=Ammoniphilus sp. CFH 90114 TaxID=2493665 RepID=UPI00100EF6AA|nr:YvrJ family protein [Ammoniphilus sp. CFH 90114]RXT00965.1 YvrJ family protein [Ammoniphilus sp. CFH 90114]